jgi:ABC-type amino acid transport substrate-binding protein
MKAIAGRLHLRPVFVTTQWESILQQMQENRYDCIVGGITITAVRQQILAWSDPYMTTTLNVIINSARTPGIRGLADLKDATVGVQAATTDYNVAIGMQIRGEIKSVKVYPFDRIGNAISDLANGQITAVIKVYPVAVWLVRKTPGLRIIAQIPHDPQPLGIGFNKNTPASLPP